MEVLKCVVHSVDNEMKTAILSNKQVNLNQAQELDAMVVRLTKSLLSSITGCNGFLNEGSYLHEYVGTAFDFMETSLRIANAWFDQYIASNSYTSCNLVFALVSDAETVRYCMYEMMTKSGFVKVVNQQDNQLVYNSSILSDGFGGVKAAFCLDMQTGDLRLKHTADNQEYLEEILDAQSIPNAKTSLGIVNAVIGDLSHKREDDAVLNTVKAKQFVKDASELFDEVEAMSIVKTVFDDLDAEEEKQIKTVFDECKMQEMLNSKELQRISGNRKHKITTESGVEISIPIDSLQVDQVLEIQENQVGKVTIVLKNVGKIV